MPSFKSLCLVAATSLLASPALAQNGTALSEATHPWEPPSDGDVRAPCPALNSLANHGILPRDGKGIDLDTLVAAVGTGFHLASAATLVVGNVALKASRTGNASTFDLDDLDVHDPQVIEHDGSMSRNDSFWGDAHTFNNQAWDRTLDTWGSNETITYEVAANELSQRFAYGAATNPDFNATFALSGALLEYALILGAFGDPAQGDGNKTLIRYMFENERLPIELGWQPSAEEISLANVLTLRAGIKALVTV